MCVKGDLPFMKTQRITGDRNMQQNKFSYDVYGSNQHAGL